MVEPDRKSTRLNSSHLVISYAVFCLKKKTQRLNRRKLHALRAVLDELLRWPAGCLDSAPKVVQIGLGSLEAERANGDINRGDCTHFNSSSLLAKRPECVSHLVGKQRWLLPGGEVSTNREPVVMDQPGIRPFRPAPRRFVKLVRKDAHPNRDLHALDIEEPELVLPVEASRRNPGIRQPVKRHVVEDVVT